MYDLKKNYCESQIIQTIYTKYIKQSILILPVKKLLVVKAKEVGNSNIFNFRSGRCSVKNVFKN